MYTAIYGASSALKLHQLWLEVAGTNINNVNTPGYKKSSITFQDLIHTTLSPGKLPTDGIGGVNPIQLGLGPRLSTIRTVHTPGKYVDTGRPHDLSILGEGYFVIQSAKERLYTRAGNFDVDNLGNFVTTDGYKVGGWNAVRDERGQLRLDRTNKTIIDTSEQVTSLRVVLDDIIKGKETTSAKVGKTLKLDNPVAVDPVSLSFTKELSSLVKVSKRGIDITEPWATAGFYKTPMVV